MCYSANCVMLWGVIGASVSSRIWQSEGRHCLMLASIAQTLLDCCTSGGVALSTDTQQQSAIPPFATTQSLVNNCDFLWVSMPLPIVSCAVLQQRLRHA
eukprot:15451111-Alexandrium_andersonii.AAC.2